MKINGCKIAACVLMVLAAAMLLLPFYHISFPSYFEQADETISGVELVKNSLAMTKDKMEDKVENIRTLIKDSEDLEDMYQSLGKISKLVTAVKAAAIITLCLPCLLLAAGAISGIFIGTKKGMILPAACNALAFLIHGASGAAAMFLFYHWKGELVDGIESMGSVSTGISFLDTVLDTASSVVSENIDKIKLSFQPGWFLFLALALAALACWIACLMKKEETAQENLQDEWIDPFEKISEARPENDGPMGVEGEQKEDLPTFKAVIPDINSYQDLQAVNPSRPLGTLRGLEGIYKEKTVPLGQEGLVMGRDGKAANLVFHSESGRVSRLHCRISYDAGQKKYRVTDYSKNGVFIHTFENGRYVSHGKLPKNAECLLAPGTIIDIGGCENRFRLE